VHIPSYTYVYLLSDRDILQDLQGEVSDEAKREIRVTTIMHSLFFVIGFSIIFVSLGLTVTYLGQALFEYQSILKKIGAVLIIFFGLMISGVLKVGFLEKEKRLQFRKSGITYLGSFLVGATFAIAWTPCVGPILGSILVYASSTASIQLGTRLLTVFSLGLAIPFMLSAILINSLLLYVNKIKNYLKWVNLIGGAILVGFGILILTGGIR
jgi:cytochrome c-type biogenesis protein